MIDYQKNNIEQTAGKKIKEFLVKAPVLWLGWECDSEAWVIRFEDDSVEFWTTSHGSPYKVNDPEAFVQERRKEYEESSTALIAALLAVSEEAND